MKMQEDITWEQLKTMDGAEVEYHINQTKGIGKLSVERGVVFVCQNTAAGNVCNDKKGYSYSWQITNNDYKSLIVQFLGQYEIY